LKIVLRGAGQGRQRGGMTLTEYKAGLDLCIARGWLWKSASGAYVKLAQAGCNRVGGTSCRGYLVNQKIAQRSRTS
jgi:hypothetical protein